MSQRADLAARIAGLTPRGRRLLVAIAGAPGSGKSTLAEALVDDLGPSAALVPMDGFHLDNTVIRSRGLLDRKGAPPTFDGAGFVHMIRRLRDEDEVAIPVFDRARDLAIAGARIVGPEATIAVVEGNYLLLRSPPWDRLADLWDFSVFLEVPEAELERRLVQRWLDHGLAPDAARARAEGNDLPNARLVVAESRSADVIINGG